MARVLIVEDEITDLIFLRNIVEGAGHEVFVASDGEQAFKAFLRKRIDVVVTDLHMPCGDGLEFIEALGGCCQLDVARVKPKQEIGLN